MKPTAERPALILLDNHSSRFDYEMMEFAKQNHVILFTLPPNSTDKIQPLDVSIHGPFKANLHKAIDSLPAGTIVTINNIVSILAQPWMDACNPRSIQTSFNITGIVPLDKTAIPDDQLAPSLSFRNVDKKAPPLVLSNLIPVPPDLLEIVHMPAIPLPKSARKWQRRWFRNPADACWPHREAQGGSREEGGEGEGEGGQGCSKG